MLTLQNQDLQKIQIQWHRKKVRREKGIQKE